MMKTQLSFLLPLIVLTGTISWAGDVGRDLLIRARGGDVTAMRTLGKHLYYGADGIPQQRNNAIKWWKEAVQNGDTKSMILLGQVYETGKGAPKDLRKAFELYKQALDGGDKKAIDFIKKLPSDITRSWWKDRAEDDVSAMMYLANSFFKKKEKIVTEKEASEYLCRAAQKGNKKALAQMKELPLNDTLPYWNERMNQKDEEAMRFIADCYEQGLHTEVNDDKAAEVYSRILSLHEGDSPEKFKEMLSSLPWKYQMNYYMKKAETGDVKAMMTLAHEYDEGSQNAPDPELAKKYYLQAASYDNEEAVKWLKARNVDFKTRAEREAEEKAEREAEEKARAARAASERAEAEANRRRFLNMVTDALKHEGKSLRNIRFLTMAGPEIIRDTRMTEEELLNPDSIDRLFIIFTVSQKIASDMLLCICTNGNVIAVQVSDFSNVQDFVDDDRLTGVLVRDGDYSYQSKGGRYMTVGKYILILGRNTRDN